MASAYPCLVFKSPAPFPLSPALCICHSAFSLHHFPIAVTMPPAEAYRDYVLLYFTCFLQKHYTLCYNTWLNMRTRRVARGFGGAHAARSTGQLHVVPAPPRVAFGAPADCFRSFNRTWRRGKDVVGGGTNHHTRGRVCPQNLSILCIFLSAITLAAADAANPAKCLSMNSLHTKTSFFRQVQSCPIVANRVLRQ